MKKEYVNNLEKLDFQIETQNNSSIYLVEKQAEYIRQKESAYIIIALDKAREFKADAVYFRFFDDKRPPLAQIYIYDNILFSHDQKYYNEIHRNIWSGSEISVYMIVDKTNIKVFDGRKPVNIVNNEIETHPIDVISLDAIDLFAQNEAMEKYKAQLFNNGAFWETDTAEKHFLYSTGATERLLKSLREVRLKFRQKIKNKPEFSDRLLIMCILIKYLEENGTDSETNKNLARDFFKIKTGHETLEEILYNNKLSNLLIALSEHFNGGIFSMTDRKYSSKNVYDDIEKVKQKDLAVFFDAGSSENLFGWQEYSFEHIPIELISNLYEEFIPRQKTKKGKVKDTPENGAVYTPSFLVNLLIDECLPLNFTDTNENIKLIDPACGSGIFLVTAYKRLVQRWRIKNRKNGVLADPEPDNLKQILKNNIFGIDIHYNSVHLTIFSLQLALCSMLKPRQIWIKQGLFNDLENDGNIIEKDFFDYLAENHFSRNFDLVVGNPPFKELPKKDFIAYKEKLAKIEEKEKINLEIPFYQEALLFLSTSFLLLKKEIGKLCLIMKSGPFLYGGGDDDTNQRKTLIFRQTLFEQYNVTQIIDFTLLKKLFSANVETSAVFIDNKPAKNDTIKHIVVRESRSVAERSYFELSHYDFHDIPSHIVASTPYVWKCNLLGGTQVYHLANRIKRLRKLKKYLEDRKADGWDYGQGYIVGNKSKRDVNNVIFGKYTVVDKYFKDDGIERKEIQKEKYFKDIPSNSKSIFSPPHLLIKKTIGKNSIPIELRKDYLTFRNEILGIHCPHKEQSVLLNLEKFLKNNNKILRFFIVTTSARAGVIRSIYTSDLDDLLNMPIFTKKTFNTSISEQIIIDDVLNYYIEEFSRGKNASVHKEIAKVEEHIKAFSEVYCDSMNKIYADNQAKRYFFSKLIEGKSFFACEYTFGDGNDFIHEKWDKDIDSLLYTWNPSHSVRYSRVIRIYGDDRILLVKPKKLMFWLKSIALRDFDDTLKDSLKRK